jgi:hypothetical protein
MRPVFSVTLILLITAPGSNSQSLVRHRKCIRRNGYQRYVQPCSFLIALKLVFAGDGLISLDEFSQLINGLGLEHATPGTVVALFNKYNWNSKIQHLEPLQQSYFAFEHRHHC